LNERLESVSNAVLTEPLRQRTRLYQPGSSTVAVDLTVQTRIGDLLITSDQSCVAEVCTGLQMPHIYAVFFSGACPRLHRIALPVVSEWCQCHPRIRVTRSSTPSSVAFSGLTSSSHSSTSPARVGPPLWTWSASAPEVRVRRQYTLPTEPRFSRPLRFRLAPPTEPRFNIPLS
jgi:hypothetical protein